MATRKPASVSRRSLKAQNRRLSFEQLGTRLLLSGTPIERLYATTGTAEAFAVEVNTLNASGPDSTNSDTYSQATTTAEPLPVWWRPILTFNPAGNVTVNADPGAIFTVVYTNLDQAGRSVSKVLQGTGTIQEIVLSTDDLVSLAYIPAQGGRIRVAIADDYPVPAGFRMPDLTLLFGSPTQTSPQPNPVSPTPTPLPGTPAPLPGTLPTPGTPSTPAPAPTVTVRNVVRELRPKIGREQTEDTSALPYYVTLDGLVDIGSLREGATWYYSIDDGPWITGSGSSLTLPVAGPQRLAVKQVRPLDGNFYPEIASVGVVVDPDWGKPLLSWSGVLPDHYHVWYKSRVAIYEQLSGTWSPIGFASGYGTARDIKQVAANASGESSGLLLSTDTWSGFLDFLPKTKRDRLIPNPGVDEVGNPRQGFIPKGSPVLLDGTLLDGPDTKLREIVLSLEVFLQSDINGDGSVEDRPSAAAGVRVESNVAQMSPEVSGDTPLVVYAARGVPGVSGRVYLVGESGLTADNTYESGDLEDYKVLRLSNGKPVVAPTIPVALRPSTSGVEVLFKTGTSVPMYQSRVFSLQSGRALGKPSAVTRDAGVLEAEYATDLNGDGVLGNAITITAVLDPSDQQPNAGDEGSLGVYRASGVPGTTGSSIVVGDPNLEAGETYLDAELARLTVLRGATGRPLGAAFTPVAVRDDGAQFEVLYKPSPTSSVHQTQRFNAATGRAIGRPSKPIQSLASIEGVFAQDLNSDGVIGTAFTVTSVVDGASAPAGGGPGSYGLYWSTGLRQGTSLIVSDRDLVAGGVYQEGDVATTVELVTRKGSPLPTTLQVVAIRESTDTVEVLYRSGTGFQAQQFNLSSGRAVGNAGPLRSDIANLEDEFDQDLNEDGSIG